MVSYVCPHINRDGTSKRTLAGGKHAIEDSEQQVLFVKARGENFPANGVRWYRGDEWITRASQRPVGATTESLDHELPQQLYSSNAPYLQRYVPCGSANMNSTP